MGYNKKLSDIVNIDNTEVDNRYNYWKERVDAITSATIMQGFSVNINGIPHLFKYTLIDQANMANARADALASIQVSMISSSKLESITLYGVNSNGQIALDKAPTVDIDQWNRKWAAYIEGVKTTITLDVLTMLMVARSADNHVFEVKEYMTSKYLEPLKACTTVSEMNTLAMSLHIDKKYNNI